MDPEPHPVDAGLDVALDQGGVQRKDLAPVSVRARRRSMPSWGRATHSQAPMIMLGSRWIGIGGLERMETPTV